MLKPRYELNNGQMADVISIKFYVEAWQIELAIDNLLSYGDDINVKSVESQIRMNLRCMGYSCEGYDRQNHYDKILPIAKKLFPSFY